MHQGEDMSSSSYTADGPVLGQRRRYVFGPAGQVRTGREFAAKVLLDWGLACDELFDEDVRLIVSELVSNACLHGGGPRELVLVLADRSVRIEVLDAGEGVPEPRSPHRTSRPGGHGLHIVGRLSTAWGVLRAPGAKAVWAEVALPGTP
ncbi:anti-sigma regulatory factor (Ser/Thr protein kinase) [Streptomyces sp. TLI_235]|nr:anti-sigma regulatory factor (Ser/Thr protein kinase) [Streptomyces sp. TLI_235]